jgi:hypothetical protein
MKRKSLRKNADYNLAHVLYQKLGKNWYAFTEVDGDCFMTKVEDEGTHHTAQKTDSCDEQKNIRKRRAA